MFEGFFSDLLFNSWYCANIDLCRWSKKENVDRRRNLTKQEFVDQYESKGIPVVIEGIVDKWPAYRNFNREYLENKYGHLAFKTDKQISVKLSNYLKYCDSVREERPIYLFDNMFSETTEGSMSLEYSVPIYFQEDFFSLLEDRPSYRWLLVGPARAGATFHKDPNWTSAWNGLVSGHKKWIMWPPDVPPLGVIPSDDGLDVTVNHGTVVQ
eukprot:TRINITY_DN659_c1_g1_i5.p1 TRINITY_DN659_c1_g1~~TRINITY_DN659_c1_g1_i5.p1  ORF type:complete len:211 (-),score=35.58 TRINITY_DN659_c1_g1_i5:544-1176(-)